MLIKTLKYNSLVIRVISVILCETKKLHRGTQRIHRVTQRKFDL